VTPAQLRAFSAVVRHGSVREAAIELQVTEAAISFRALPGVRTYVRASPGGRVEPGAGWSRGPGGAGGPGEPGAGRRWGVGVGSVVCPV
jgi:hypothetical protein